MYVLCMHKFNNIRKYRFCFDFFCSGCSRKLGGKVTQYKWSTFCKTKTTATAAATEMWLCTKKKNNYNFVGRNKIVRLLLTVSNEISNSQKIFAHSPQLADWIFVFLFYCFFFFFCYSIVCFLFESRRFTFVMYA